MSARCKPGETCNTAAIMVLRCPDGVHRAMAKDVARRTPNSYQFVSSHRRWDTARAAAERLNQK